MEQGWAALGGALVGGVVTAFSNAVRAFVKDKLAERKKARNEKAAKEVLRTMLARAERPWTKLTVLTSVTGLGPIKVRRMLLEIGARGSIPNGTSWALISRKPLSKNNEPDVDPEADADSN